MSQKDDQIQPSGPRGHASAEARRIQILTAALGCFSEKGYHSSTMDDLVAASGLSKGSLYWHFKSKEEVFLALLDAFTLELFLTWDRLEATESDPETLVRRECEATIALLSSDRPRLLAWAEFLTHPAARARLAAGYLSAHERLAEIIRSGQALGQFAPKPGPDRVAIAFIGAVEGLLIQYVVLEDFDLETNFDATWSLLMGGLRR